MIVRGAARAIITPCVSHATAVTAVTASTRAHAVQKHEMGLLAARRGPTLNAATSRKPSSRLLGCACDRTTGPNARSGISVFPRQSTRHSTLVFGAAGPLTTRPCYSRRWLTSPSSPPSKEESSSDGRDQGRRSSDKGSGSGDGAGDSLWSKMVESAATSAASIVMLGIGFGLAGYGYHKFYKHLVLRKMVVAFEPGDPMLELAAMGRGVPKHLAGGAAGLVGGDGTYEGSKSSSANGDHDPDPDEDQGEDGNYWIERPEQMAVDAIVTGQEVGHYYLFLGEKGTGKSSMLLEAMAKIDAEGVAMFDAHSDLEIFRIRLGKALNYEYNEDYIGGYFSERGPRESTALLDIERALNKLEKVALQRRNARGAHHPLVVIVNQTHLIRDDDDGRDLIELLQQRAEQWAAAGLVTFVFNSDDYWVYERFKQLSSRLEVHSIQDLSRQQATRTLQRYRLRYFGERVSDSEAAAVYDRVGGRLTFLNRVARSSDMLATCDHIVQSEKTWFLNQCWILGAEMDDDVMDQQKWAAAAMTLALALVDKEEEMKHTVVPDAGDTADHTLPSFAIHEAQQIMTRADFVREMDRRNLFAITSQARVRAASVPMMAALRQICSAPGFRDTLEATVQRIADIESLGRTRELVAKDLVLGGRYEVGPSKRDSKRTEMQFRGWSPHERPSRDPPETTEK